MILLISQHQNQRSMPTNVVYNLKLYFQLVTPKFPVVVKIGHAHAGMGKVRVSLPTVLRYFDWE